MNRISDRINGRSFMTNTIEGAEIALNYFLSDNPALIRRTKQVTELLGIILTKLGYTSDESEELLIATNLSNIGYSKDLVISGFNYYDAYIYLKENGWEYRICRYVLNANMARELALFIKPDIYDTYLEQSNEIDYDHLMLMTLANYSVDAEGGLCTLQETLDYTHFTYGYNSNAYRHTELVISMLKRNDTTKKLIEELKL